MKINNGFTKLPTEWICKSCNYCIISEKEPDHCPACSHDAEYIGRGHHHPKFLEGAANKARELEKKGLLP